MDFYEEFNKNNKNIQEIIILKKDLKKNIHRK
jgi:hypothetical protein